MSEDKKENRTRFGPSVGKAVERVMLVETGDEEGLTKTKFDRIHL